MSPLAIILVVVLFVLLLGGGYGYRSGYLGSYGSYGYAPVPWSWEGKPQAQVGANRPPPMPPTPWSWDGKPQW